MKDFNRRKTVLDWCCLGGVPKENRGQKIVLLEAFEDVAAHKPAGACEQNLQSDQVQLFANGSEIIEREVYLFVGMGRHQTDPDQFGTWRYCRINDRIDEHASLVQAFTELKGQGHVAAIDGQDRGFGCTQLEAQT